MPIKKNCRLCKGTNLKMYLDLGHHPHSDRFLSKEQLNEEEDFYPLRVEVCQDCGFHQLDYVVPPKVLYQGEYMYESSITETGKKHYFSMADEICRKLGLKKDSLAIDIGSNVGVLLEGFKNNGMKILGVDPAPIIAKIANDRGIETECDLFTEYLAKKILIHKGKASVITGTNVFAHIDDLDDVMKAADTLLTDDGVFIFESPYLVDLIENLEYDTVYHQHLSYLSIKPLIPFFRKFGFEIFDVYRSKIHGGSIRVFIGRIGKRPVQQIVKDLIELEDKDKIYSMERLAKFAKDVEKQRFELVSMITDLRKKGKRVVGIGAPAKGNTLLNYCALNSGMLDYLTEKSKLKAGRFSPGMHLPIYTDEKLVEDNPDYALILPWNFSEEIMKNLSKFSENGGKFIIPIPTPRIVGTAEIIGDSESSKVVKNCQICGSTHLEPILFLGYFPPVNSMHNIGEKPHEQPSYPAQILFCKECTLVQLGLVVNPKILFPKEYPYTSSTTKVLRENFAELYQECSSIIPLSKDDLVMDIGSNDGNLLSNFKDKHKVLGVTPEDIGRKAIEKGIPTIIDYFNKGVVQKIHREYGKAKIITATNVFAHIDDVNDVVKNILDLLNDDGVFISESHYLLSLIETLQYDTIYHEHLRYYSLHSLKYLLEKSGLEIFHVKKIPTHGGSIRVYAARKGKFAVKNSVKELLDEEERKIMTKEKLLEFGKKVMLSKLELHSLLCKIKENGERIYGIGAPSRASTLISYTGIDNNMVESIMEVKGSHKVGKYMPGTIIPVTDESELYSDQPEYAMLFSWHIADELMPKIREKGFKGAFIIPLPKPRIVR